MNVRVGQKVDIVDHDYGNDNRYGAVVTEVEGTTVTITPRTPWRSQGRAFYRTMVDLDQLEFNGNVGTLYRTPAAHTGKPRVSVKSHRFEVQR